MESLHTEIYDHELQQKVEHYRNYPEMLPFIGNKWQEQKNKILLVGESHYLPKGCNNLSSPNTWYTKRPAELDKHKSYIHTRNVIDNADYLKKFEKGLTIFYNIKSALKSCLPALKNEELIFPFVSFYNYFQRPSERTGKSIWANFKDIEIAYNTLIAISEMIKPDKIIFISTFARKSFKSIHKEQKSEVFNNIKIGSVPHPACAWWNRKSKNNGNKTGKQRFIELIQE